jgi:hypothetical protein
MTTSDEASQVLIFANDEQNINADSSQNLSRAGGPDGYKRRSHACKCLISLGPFEVQTGAGHS